jgi:hypothetical protein
MGGQVGRRRFGRHSSLVRRRGPASPAAVPSPGDADATREQAWCAETSVAGEEYRIGPDARSQHRLERVDVGTAEANEVTENAAAVVHCEDDPHPGLVEPIRARCGRPRRSAEGPLPLLGEQEPDVAHHDLALQRERRYRGEWRWAIGAGSGRPEQAVSPAECRVPVDAELGAGLPYRPPHARKRTERRPPVPFLQVRDRGGGVLAESAAAGGAAVALNTAKPTPADHATEVAARAVPVAIGDCRFHLGRAHGAYDARSPGGVGMARTACRISGWDMFPHAGESAPSPYRRGLHRWLSPRSVGYGSALPPIGGASGSHTGLSPGSDGPFGGDLPLGRAWQSASVTGNCWSRRGPCVRGVPNRRR